MLAASSLAFIGLGLMAAVLPVISPERGAEASRVASRRKPELPSVLAAELRGAVVSHPVGHGGDVVGSGEQQQARFLQADLLLELDRAERGDGLEVAVERGRAHAAGASEVLDAKRLVVVLGDPPDRAADVGDDHARPLARQPAQRSPVHAVLCRELRGVLGEQDLNGLDEA